MNKIHLFLQFPVDFFSSKINLCFEYTINVSKNRLTKIVNYFYCLMKDANYSYKKSEKNGMIIAIAIIMPNYI